MQELLQVKRICKAYPSFALQDVSFRVAAGTITGFIGRNGAGKTTTIRVLLGLSPYESGSVSFFGAPVDAKDPQVRSRLGVVLDGGFFDELSAEAMKKIIAPAYPSWQEADFLRYMDRFSLKPRQKLRTYSRGMRAKFALALALSHRAELLILDEPTSGLDPLIRREMLSALQDYIRDGERAVLFSTHITSDLDRIADEVILLDQGRVLWQQNRDELLDTYRLVKGTRSQLTPQVQALVHSISETPFGFTGITDNAPVLKQAVPGIVLERAAIEDIMAANVAAEGEDCVRPAV